MNYREKVALGAMFLPLGQMLQNISEKIGATYSLGYLLFTIIAFAIFIITRKNNISLDF